MSRVRSRRTNEFPEIVASMGVFFALAGAGIV